jgi:hypothetical protein
MFIAALILSIASLSSLSHAKSKNESTLNHICKPGEHWVRAHSQSAYVRSDGTHVSGSFHKAHCQNNPPAYAIWNERLKNSFPPQWEFKNEKTKLWSDAEKERVLEALSSLPDALLLQSVEGIYRMKTYLDHPANPAANHNHQIVVYDEAFKPKQNLASIMAHEFAHNLCRQLYDSPEGDSYALAADWMLIPVTGTNTRILMPKPSREFVEKDGEDSLNEDLSNNIEYFLFNPQELKRKTPKVYDWITKKYGDKFKLGKGR